MRRLALLSLVVGTLVPSLAVPASSQAPGEELGPPPEPVVRIYGDLGDVTTTRRTDVRVYVPYEAQAADPSWDVEVARADVLSPRSDLRWSRVVSGSRRASIPVGTPRATVTCARVRLVVDEVAGAWSDRRCIVRPFDDGDLVAHGGRVVTDHRYPDGRATVLTGDARLVLRGVPKRVRFGPVYTQIDRPGETCALPRWGIGRPGPNDRARGTSRSDGVTRMGRITPRRGRAVVVGNGVGNECALGGFLVFPRWVKAPYRT